MTQSVIHVLKAPDGQEFKPDLLGQWYEVGRERGKSDVIHFMRIDQNNNVVDEFESRHAFHDGMGAFTTLLRSVGYEISAPWQRRKLSPNFLQWAAALKQFGGDNTPHPSPWWSKFDGSLPYRPDIRTHRLFTTEQTAQILSQAKKNNVTFNAWALSALHKAVAAQFFAPEKTVGRWLIPVNFRNESIHSESLGNHASYFGLPVDSRHSVSDIAFNFSKGVESRGAWLTEKTAAILSFMGPSAIRKMTSSSKPNHWMGTFSNMGTWPAISQSQVLPEIHSKTAAWIAVPPAGSPTYPVGVVAMTWAGRLSLGIRLHPALGATQNDLNTLLESFVSNLFHG